MDSKQALEMVEALLSDNEQSIDTLNQYGDEVAITLYTELLRLREDNKEYAGMLSNLIPCCPQPCISLKQLRENFNLHQKRFFGLLKENKRLREALEFYANEDNWEIKSVDAGCGCCSDIIDSEIDKDDGAIAREALQSKEEAKFGGWYICDKCHKKVTNGEECKNCKSEED